MHYCSAKMNCMYLWVYTFSIFYNHLSLFTSAPIFRWCLGPITKGSSEDLALMLAGVLATAQPL